MKRLVACSVLVLAIFAPACGDDAVAPDAGLDAAMDAGSDAGPRDAGPMCEPTCPASQDCCAVGDGVECISVVRDITNCGRCGLDCVATGRGDSCQASQCACGDFLLGCVGGVQSTCCVSDEPGGRPPHCANLARDPLDCGACGNECDALRANACQGRLCVCGASRAPCEGADRCCPDRTGTYSCVDGMTDDDHCGECGNRCASGMRCEAGSCV